MMTGFKRRFEPFVQDGSKEHTMRDIRKGTRQVVVGDRLDCYGDVRQKAMHLIGRWTCVRIQVARFYVVNGEHHRMSLDGAELSDDEADAFAWRDGFRYQDDPKARYGCFVMMLAYWLEDGKRFPFQKQVLHWRFKDRLPDELPKKPRRRRNLAIDHQRVAP